MQIDTYIVYEINLWSSIQDTAFALGNSLFGADKLTKNTDPDNIIFLALVVDLIQMEVFCCQMVVRLVKML